MTYHGFPFLAKYHWHLKKMPTDLMNTIDMASGGKQFQSPLMS